MTCVIGLLSDGICYIGADSCGSNGYVYENCNRSKVFKVGDFVIGGTTSFRMLDLLEFSFVPRKMYEDENIEKYMRTEFVKTVRSCLKEGGFCKIDSCVDKGGEFLIGYKNNLFRMQDDFSVITQVNYDAVGCGHQAAIGSLFTTKSCEFSPTERIRVALEAAESVMVGVKGPFTIIST